VAKLRWSRTEALRNATPIDIWPTVSLDGVEDSFREQFLNRCNAVRMYVEGEAGATIEAVTGIPRTFIHRLTAKCLELAGDGRILGFRALIPHIHLNPYNRTAEIKPKFQEAQGGLSGIFRRTLDKHPKIEETLIQLIRKKHSSEHNVHEKRIRARNLHRFFLKSLKEAGVSDGEWPFNTKHLGLKTIQKYMDTVLDESFGRSVTAREEQAAIAHLAVGGGHETFLSFEEPYDVVELDAYSINAFFTAEFATPEGTIIEILLDRLWLVALIEQVSSSILSYSVVYRSEVSADDVLGVIRKALNPPIKVELTIPGLTYPSDAGLPSQVIPECVGAVWNVMLLDGALAHLSRAVRDRARNELGFVLNWGPVGHFERRPNIERFFKRISDDIFMRYPSTTGSNPGHGRAKNAEENATRYQLRADEAEQIIAVYIAQHNATPSKGISYLSPLEVLKHYLVKQSEHFLLRHLPKTIGTTTNILPLIKECTVRGGRASGRRPYVEIDGVRYTNPVLAQSAALIGRKLIVEIDEDDMRFVKAYLENGAELGMLKAGGRWWITKHSRKTRKIINSLIAKKILVISSLDDPIQVYMKYLSKQNGVKKRHKKIIPPTQATEAVRISKEAGLKKTIWHAEEQKFPILSAPIKTPQKALINKPMPDLNKLLKK
jgi:putative transposase